MGVGEKLFSRFQFRCSHWQNPTALASERLVRVQARFEDDLRQADFRGHAEPLVNRAPLREEGPVPAGVHQQCISTR